MLIYKHKHSGKYFIYIQDAGYNKALFVTPESKIKPLELSQFTDEVNEDEGYLICHHLIEAEQAQKYHEYKKRRSEDNFENAEDLFDEMTESEKKRFREQLVK